MSRPHGDSYDHPECPHCGHADEEWWDGLSRHIGDGDTFTPTCDGCEKEYEATMTITYSFSTVAVDQTPAALPPINEDYAPPPALEPYPVKPAT